MGMCNSTKINRLTLIIPPAPRAFGEMHQTIQAILAVGNDYFASHMPKSRKGIFVTIKRSRQTLPGRIGIFEGNVTAIAGPLDIIALTLGLATTRIKMKGVEQGTIIVLIIRPAKPIKTCQRHQTRYRRRQTIRRADFVTDDRHHWRIVGAGRRQKIMPRLNHRIGDIVPAKGIQ